MSLNLNYNLIIPKNNNFRQNPEYFFFKTKRESFRDVNLFSSLKVLEIELDENKILDEMKIYEEKKLEEKISLSNKIATNNNDNSYTSKLTEVPNNLGENNEFMSPLDKIKQIINGNIKEYIPKTFKIVVKESKID